MNGAARFARFAYPPNELGYCGPPEHRRLLDYAASGTVDAGLLRLESAFDAPPIYLSVLAEAAGLTDPFDDRVVEAYWIGNDLLDAVDPERFARSLEQRITPSFGKHWAPGAGPHAEGAVANHIFHVLEVYPWAGLLHTGRPEPIEILDRCRIRWGEVVHLSAHELVASVAPLVHVDGQLMLSKPVEEVFTRSSEGQSLVDDLDPGDHVAIHWNWVCDRLTDEAVGVLERVSRRQIDITNSTLARRQSS